MVVCSNNVYEVVSNLANYFEHTIYLCMDLNGLMTNLVMSKLKELNLV